jgi:hypothetical protein
MTWPRRRPASTAAASAGRQEIDVDRVAFLLAVLGERVGSQQRALGARRGDLGRLDGGMLERREGQAPQAPLLDRPRERGRAHAVPVDVDRVPVSQPQHRDAGRRQAAQRVEHEHFAELTGEALLVEGSGQQSSHRLVHLGGGPFQAAGCREDADSQNIAAMGNGIGDGHTDGHATPPRYVMTCTRTIGAGR